MKKLILMLIITMMQNGVFGQKSFLDQPYIETSAKADTLVMPDKIFLSIIISEADSKNKKSVESQEKEMLEVFKSLHIDIQKQLEIQDLSSRYIRKAFSGKDIVKIKHYELLVNDATTASRILIALETLEISNVRIDRTEYSKANAVVLDLQKQAVAKTKIIADKWAKSLGQKVGKAIHISEYGFNGMNHHLQGKAAGVAIRGASQFSPSDGKFTENPELPIEFKKIHITAQMQVKYLLE